MKTPYLDKREKELETAGNFEELQELHQIKTALQELEELKQNKMESRRKKTYCSCPSVMIMRDINTDIPYCSECGKVVNEYGF